jgi:hypothetical protein
MQTPGVAVLVGALLTATAALAQPSNIFQLNPTDTVAFRTWVATQNVIAVPAPTGFTVAVGAVVPPTIMFYEIPATVGVAAATPYRYAMIGDRLVLIDPADRRIVYVVG